jgi:hypothetical protein
MSPPWWILNPNLELVQPLWITTQHLRQPQLLQFFLQSRWQAGVHATPSRENDRFIKRRADVNVSGLNCVEEELGDARLFHIDKMGLEETFRGFETLATNSDHTTIWQSVAFYQNSCIFAQPLI